MHIQWFRWPAWYKALATPGPIPVLDGVRACAVLLVLYGHLSPTVYGQSMDAVIAHFSAHAGVELFFVLSGFLISYRFWLHLLGQSQPVSYRSYGIRRLLRIYPLYLTYMALMFVYFGIYHIPWSELWYYVFFYIYPIQNFVSYINVVSPHTWTIAVEEHFYVLLALYFFAFRKSSIRNHLIALAVIVVTSFCYRLVALYWIAHGADVREVLHANTLAKLDIFVFGMLLALYFVHRHKQLSPQYVRYALYCGMLLMAMMLSLEWLSTKGTVWFIVAGLLLHTGTALAWASLLFAVLGGYWAWLQSPILIVLGKLSFSLYLLHPVLHHVLYSRLLELLGVKQNLWTTLAFLPILFAVALASYLLIEKPFLDKKQLWARYNDAQA